MTTSILVPIDISAENSATPAIAMALDLAKLENGKLTFLNVVEQFTGYTSTFLPEDFYEKSVANARKSLEEIAVWDPQDEPGEDG